MSSLACRLLLESVCHGHDNLLAGSTQRAECNSKAFGNVVNAFFFLQFHAAVHSSVTQVLNALASPSDTVVVCRTFPQLFCSRCFHATGTTVEIAVALILDGYRNIPRILANTSKSAFVHSSTAGSTTTKRLGRCRVRSVSMTQPIP